MRALLLFALVAAGCFDPAFPSELACDDGRCPPGYRCGTDEVCRRTGGPQGGDGGGVISDASPPDAAPVACDGDEDCMNPDDPCLLAGPCEDGTCRFAEMDCSGLDGDCTQGICDDGACVAKPVRQDQACGAGTMACGPFGSCVGFADSCDESGTQTRSCTDSTCQAGECVEGAPYDDSMACSRDTDGTECMPSTATDCAACAYSTICDNDAPAVTCTCTDYDCVAGSCTPSSASCVEDICHRNTEGQQCSASNCCTAQGTCGSDACI